jgi:DNA repair protein RecO (recombination protein O)
VSELGVAPAIDVCAECHDPIPAGATVYFSHRSGGALCDRCGARAPAARKLPPAARDALRAAFAGESIHQLDTPSLRAHQRLLREFLAEHLADGRPLKAFALWESQQW